MSTVRRFVKNRTGSAKAEYGIIAAMISLIAIGALQAVAAQAATNAL